jgi:hypothetical protein
MSYPSDLSDGEFARLEPLLPAHPAKGRPWLWTLRDYVNAIAKFSDADFAQLNSCLHFANFEVGLLINFRTWPLKDGGIKRLVNTRP